jgi:hypothetical protein
MPVVPAVRGQRSHLLLVLSNPAPGQEPEFAGWFTGAYRDALGRIPAVLGSGLFEHDELDVTNGSHPRQPFGFLTVCELGIDGAEDAADTIAAIAALHRESGLAADPATWLYFPISEKAGASTPDAAGLVIAFANAVPGHDDEFREWYSTRHIRHALYLPTLASGQCFERTLFQEPGAVALDHRLIAVYELTGSAQEFLGEIDGIDHALLAFPTMDPVHFSESAFRRIG